MTVANGSAGKISHLPVIGIVPSQNTTEKMVSFPERPGTGGRAGHSHLFEERAARSLYPGL